MTPPRHNWKHHSGDGRAYPPEVVRRCAYCGVFVRMKVVTTSRIGVTTASFTNRDVPIYSTDETRWSYAKPACTGKAKV